MLGAEGYMRKKQIAVRDIRLARTQDDVDKTAAALRKAAALRRRPHRAGLTETQYIY